ncbi:MAG: hypothetical protein ACR2J8_11810, partial [Thermomicrobiales bacterium]
MDHQRFDRAARLLAATLNRRRQLAALLGVAASVAAPIAPAVDARRRPSSSGPCGNLGRNNVCQRDSDCCTGHCWKRTGKLNRCRCLKRGETCHMGQTC